MKKHIKIFAALALLLQMQTVDAYPGEKIALDANGDYVVTYWNGANLMQMTFSPATKIEPKVKSKLHLSSINLIAYNYTISNGGAAKQPITSIRIGNVTSIYGSQSMPSLSSITMPEVAIAAVQKMGAALATPRKWVGVAHEDPKNSSTFQAGWLYSSEQILREKWLGIMPGGEVSGFGFSSFDLPGISEMRIEGDVENHGAYEDEGPDPAESEIALQLEQIEKNNFVRRYIATPLIAIPLPFDAAVLLDRIRAEMLTWPSKQLLNTAYSAQLDLYLVAAANAFRLNQPKVAREQIESARKMVAKEHHHVDHDDEDNDDGEERKAATRFTIDRLAARVLDFDLRYVLKRTERDHEGREGHEQKKR